MAGNASLSKDISGNENRFVSKLLFVDSEQRLWRICAARSLTFGEQVEGGRCGFARAWCSGTLRSYPESPTQFMLWPRFLLLKPGRFYNMIHIGGFLRNGEWLLLNGGNVHLDISNKIYITIL